MLVRSVTDLIEKLNDFEDLPGVFTNSSDSYVGRSTMRDLVSDPVYARHRRLSFFSDKIIQLLPPI